MKKKRTNPKTGYPISTKKQVELAKSQIDFNNPAFANPNIYANLTTDSEKLDFIIAFSKNVYYLGDYYYKSGEWDTAEMEWLKLIYLMPKAIRRLAVLYKKEKRYRDIIEIYKESSKSIFIARYYRGNEISLNEMVAAKINYTNHVIEDVSLLSDYDFNRLKALSPFPTT